MNSKIGILVSGGWGAGWSTWGEPEMAVDQELVKAFEDEVSDKEKIAIADKNWPGQYQGGLLDCYVEWVEKGTAFEITEFDGYESIKFRDDDDLWAIA